MKSEPSASEISVREVLEKLDNEFALIANAVGNGEFALWVGSGISQQAPNLGNLIERAFEFLRQKSLEQQYAQAFTRALDQAIGLTNLNYTALRPNYRIPFSDWPDKDEIVKQLWNRYSDLLDIRVPGEKADFILWDAIDIRSAFATTNPPAATHLCIGILALEGAVKVIASANWDGFIEDAISRISGNKPGLLQVIVEPNNLREPPAPTRLFKFHGCIVSATNDPLKFRKYLTGSRCQIVEWAENLEFTPMVNSVVDVATNYKTMILGLSIQDYNLQSVFARAKSINPWPWPCAPNAPGHVFCADELSNGHNTVLRVVYGNTYDNYADDICASTHIRAWAEQVLFALVLRILSEKLIKLMKIALEDANLGQKLAFFHTPMLGLRNFVADHAEPDRTIFLKSAISWWSRLVSIFRAGKLPINPDTYEIISPYALDALQADANATSAGLGLFGLILVTLYDLHSAGTLRLTFPTDNLVTSGSLLTQSNAIGAKERPLFVVRSATEMIALHQAGAFAKSNAVVIHSDVAWKTMTGNKSSPRRQSVAPGRTGRREPLHISFEAILLISPDMTTLKHNLITEMMI